MMSRKFTAREKVLLLVLALLLLICGYWMALWQPTAAAVERARLREETAQDQIVVEEAMLGKLTQMRQALDGLNQDTEQSEIAAYDNMQNVVRILNDALSRSQSYNLIFSPVTFDGNLASRTIDMTFTCGSYDDARAILKTLDQGPYRCRITALTMLAENPAEAADTIYRDGVSVKLTITFFEYAENPPAENGEAAAQQTADAPAAS